MIEKDEVIEVADGQWESILANLAPDLIPAIDRQGRHVPCPVHGGKDGFRVFKDVKLTGGTVCNTCGIHHDGISTLMWINDWTFRETLEEIAGFLGIGSRQIESRRVVRPRPSAPAPTIGDEVEANNEIKRKLNRVWLGSIEISDPRAEPARLYLARRGLSVSIPETLRFHPSLAYFDGKEKVGEFPAIIAMVTGKDGEPVTIHRTYLTKDGRKAPVESPKKLMAYPSDRKIVGGCIRLMDGSSTIAVAEGLETALAVQEAMDLPVWCSVNALMLENFCPPEGVERVLVFADKDRPTKQHPGGHGQEAARNLVQRLWKLGIKASAIVPSGAIPEGEKSLDWLDVLNQFGSDGFPSLSSVESAQRKVA